MSLPEKRHPHAVWVHRFSRQGTCTSPSCHISLWRCLSSPVKPNRDTRKQRNTNKNIRSEIYISMYNHRCKIEFKVRHVHTKTHLFVDVSISVDIIEVEGPLEFLSDGASQQDGQSCYKVLMETKRQYDKLGKKWWIEQEYFFWTELSKPQTLWSLNVLCQMH